MSTARKSPTSLPESLEEVWDDFGRSLARKNRSDATREVYRKSYEQFWTWALDQGLKPDPAVVDTAVLNDWGDALVKAPLYQNGKLVMVTDPKTGETSGATIAASTRRIRFVNLRPFFSWYAREFDTVNPFDRADIPTLGHEEPIPVVAIEDIRALLATCNGRSFIDRRDTAIIRLLFDCGARLGELLNMTVDDWDRRHDWVMLRGKTETRAVPTSASTGEALARYVRMRKDHKKNNLHAFWLASKGALGPSGVAQMLKRRCDEAGIAHLHPHMARHTWAHEFRAEGGGEGDLMYLAGWRSTTMAHRYGKSAQAQRAQASMRKLALGDRF